MAVPVYSEDLTDIDLAESTTGWSAYGGGGAGLGTGADFKIQSNNAIDKQITNADKGMMHNDSGVTLGANDHIIGWIYGATPGIMDTLANGGKVMAIGTSTANFNKYALEGSDTRPQGGNKPYAVRYSTSTPSPGSQVGTPGATPTFFGGGLNTTATAKGVNLGLDAFRYGTGAYITAGDATTPATILGFATEDEATANKFGLMFRFDGIYQWQGHFVVGQNNVGTATAAHFDDTESAAIVVLDTPHSQTDFTRWVIDHASTIFNCANKTFFARGTNNPGRVIINNASASSTGWKDCVWNDFGPIEGHVNVAYVDCSYNRCAQIDQNGGTFTGGTVFESAATVAMLISNLNLVTGLNFVSDGTGHAVDLGTITTTQSLTWDNSDSGYAATDGSTGNETILVSVNSGQTLTINVAAGATTPTYKNDGVGDVVVAASVPFTLSNVVSGTRFMAHAKFTTETPAGTYNGTGDSVVRLSAALGASLPQSGNVRLWNGTYYDKYAYTGVSGTDLTGISPTLSQDYDGVEALVEDFIAPVAITTDPYTTSVKANQDFDALLANASGATKYVPIRFADNTGSGFARRIEQIEE